MVGCCSVDSIYIYIYSSSIQYVGESVFWEELGQTRPTSMTQRERMEKETSRVGGRALQVIAQLPISSQRVEIRVGRKKTKGKGKVRRCSGKRAAGRYVLDSVDAPVMR